MNQSIRVTAPYQAHYADPIRLKKGMSLFLTGRIDHWDGHKWLWARAEDGREGWVPDTLVSSDQTGWHSAEYDYSAMELSCSKNDILTRTNMTHGWSWCVDGQGAAGWVPDSNLAAV